MNEQDLRQWNLLVDFRRVLARHAQGADLHPTWSDSRRAAQYADYLSLFLFGLVNPVLKTMRALCAASQLPRVQQAVCGSAFSLAGFSEAQHLRDPAVLEQLFGELAGQVPGPPPADVHQAWQGWFARESSLFAALPNMQV